MALTGKGQRATLEPDADKQQIRSIRDLPFHYRRITPLLAQAALCRRA